MIAPTENDDPDELFLLCVQLRRRVNQLAADRLAIVHQDAEIAMTVDQSNQLVEAEAAFTESFAKLLGFIEQKVHMASAHWRLSRDQQEVLLQEGWIHLHRKIGSFVGTNANSNPGAWTNTIFTNLAYDLFFRGRKKEVSLPSDLDLFSTDPKSAIRSHSSRVTRTVRFAPGELASFLRASKPSKPFKYLFLFGIGAVGDPDLPYTSERRPPSAWECACLNNLARCNQVAFDWADQAAKQLTDEFQASDESTESCNSVHGKSLDELEQEYDSQLKKLRQNISQNLSRHYWPFVSSTSVWQHLFADAQNGDRFTRLSEDVLTTEIPAGVVAADVIALLRYDGWMMLRDPKIFIGWLDAIGLRSTINNNPFTVSRYAAAVKEEHGWVPNPQRTKRIEAWFAESQVPWSDDAPGRWTEPLNQQALRSTREIDLPIPFRSDDLLQTQTS